MADKFYAEIFNHSGASYHKAMQLFPNARDEEFNAALSMLQLENGGRLLDIPAGGGYLQHYFNTRIDYCGLDFSASFDPDGDIGACSETDIPITNDSVETAICLAAMHHVEDKAGFLNELHRCLVPEGTLLIGDVVAASKEAFFLNGFVDQWNSLGHDGDFIDPPRDLAVLKKSGFKANIVNKHYHWNFANEASCHEYLRLLFALDKQPSTIQLQYAITELGAKKTSSGFHLNWSLGFIIASKL